MNLGRILLISCMHLFDAFFLKIFNEKKFRNMKITVRIVACTFVYSISELVNYLHSIYFTIFHYFEYTKIMETLLC